ncbi:MAG: hypothetical protein HY677_01065 [Chloroflexi bacterium]|nr:hypothetical protein [Chloroflexota bacterium]
MRLSRSSKDLLVEEMRFALLKMKESPDPAAKMYFFSAVYGMAQRILNIEFSPELTFVHNVLQFVYSTIMQRVVASSTGQERGILLPPHLFERLESALDDMIGMVERGEKTYPALERMSNLAYSTTGNGYYLFLKGILQV